MRKQACLTVFLCMLLLTSSALADDSLERCSYYYSCSGELHQSSGDDGNETTVCVDQAGFPQNFLDEDFAMIRDYWDRSSDSHHFLDVNEQQIAGYAGCFCEYDQKGNKTHEEYLNSAGELVLFPDTSYAAWNAEYDPDGNQTMISYSGLSGKPTLYTFFSSMIHEYDVVGRITLVRYLGANGEPVSTEGYYAWKNEYDNEKKEVRSISLGLNGEPVIPLGRTCASYVWQYDPQTNNVIREQYFGADGLPIVNEDGFSSRDTEYDTNGNATREACYGISGEPILNADGFSSLTAEFDPDTGQQLSERRFGIDGEPVLYLDQSYVGWNAITDQDGNVLRRSYFDADGKQVEAIEPPEELLWGNYAHLAQISGYFGSASHFMIPRSINGTSVRTMFDAFRNLPGLVSVEIPDTIRTLDQFSFAYTGLKELIIPEGVTAIHTNAIRDNASLSHVSLPASLQLLYGNPIIGVSEDFQAELSERNADFSLVDGMLLSKDGKHLYAYWGKEKELRLPDGILGIEPYAFAKNPWVEHIALPDNLTAVADYAFLECPNLRSVSFPASVISISQNAFLDTPAEIQAPANSYAEIYAARQYHSSRGENTAFG